MKKPTLSSAMTTALTTTAITMMAALSGQAMANTNTRPYVGAKVGVGLSDTVEVKNLNADDPKPKDFKVDADNPNTYGLNAGYTWANNLGIELAYTRYDNIDLKVNDVKQGKIETDTIGLFGAYSYYPTTTAPIYLKGKLGLVRAAVDYVPIAGATQSASDTGVGVGLGVGYDITPNFAIEGEYNYAGVNGNMDGIGIGFKFK